MTPPRRGPNTISKKNAGASLAGLLYGCTDERLAGFTAAGLAATHNVPMREVEAMLARAREVRRV